MMKFIRIFLVLVVMVTWSSLNAQVEIPKAVNDLFIKHTCFTCHRAGSKLVGPSWEDIAARKMKKSDLIASIQRPNAANWPNYPPMAPMPQVPMKDLEKMAEWLLKISPKEKK